MSPVVQQAAGEAAPLNFRAAFIALNVIALLAICAGAAVTRAHEPRVLYLLLLVPLCSSPLLQMRALNDRCALLGVFMAIYFFFYGDIDLQALLGLIDEQPTGGGLLSRAECLVLLGGVMFIAGYHLLIRIAYRPDGPRRPAKDLSDRTLAVMGIGMWLAGGAAVLVLQVVVTPDKTAIGASMGFARLGAFWTGVLMLGNYMPVLGIAALAYGYARRRSGWWLAIVVITIVGQIILALATDVKGVALFAPVLVILTRTMRDGKIPLAWILAAAIGAGLVFPVLQAYRSVLSESGASRAQGVQEFGKTVSTAVAKSKSIMQGTREERAQNIFERINLKPSIEIVAEHAGVDVPFQNGDTLTPMWLALIPRILWPTKPDVAVGILFNKEFHLGAGEDTYISPSHLGELYWNYGWTGSAIGMLLIGALFGLIGARTELSTRATVTRMLVLLATALLIGLGFESSMASPYAVWIRTMLLIALLHLCFARRSTEAAVSDAPASREGRDAAAEKPRPFPNVMR